MKRAVEGAATDYAVDWWVWRIAVSERIKDSLTEIRRWSFVDLFEAHVVLDVLEEIQEKQEG